MSENMTLYDSLVKSSGSILLRVILCNLKNQTKGYRLEGAILEVSTKFENTDNLLF